MKSNVLHIVDGLHPKRGGLPTAVLNITGLFKAAKIPYTILSFGENPDEAMENVVQFPFSLNSKFSLSKEAIEWFKGNYKDYSLIYFHSVWNTTALKIYKFVLRSNISYCISPHGSLDPFDLKKKNTLKKILGFLFINKALTNAKYIFCTSQKEKELLNYFGPKADNAVVLPLPVDYDDFIIGDRTAFRGKYGILADQFALLFLSRINYKKGLDNLIESLAELIRENRISGTGIKLLIAGDDQNEYAEGIKKLINARGLSEIVIFTGLLTGKDKAGAYTGSDLFVLPSKNENFGLAIVEALEASLPVLISKNVYIHADLFYNEDIQPGWLCKEDLSDIKDKLTAAIGDNNKPERKISAKLIGDRFRSKNLIKLYLQYFN
jgi:glycosyltransferase involved in cell wall biosynthesis